jgi:UPF0271 protein
MRHGLASINSDLGESVGIHSFGNDTALLDIVDTVNIACGMHAGDPSGMWQIVKQALDAGVTIGAHPGLPDLVGFGRRVMALSADELRDLVRYQVGALNGFLHAAGGELDHIKPHGAMFGMVAIDRALMDALCDVAVQYEVPIYGIAGTEHEIVAKLRDVPFVSEFYVDLDYDDSGMIRVNRYGAVQDMATVRSRTKSALMGTTITTTGKTISVRAESFCVHSDLPGAPEVARQVAEVIADFMQA